MGDELPEYECKRLGEVAPEIDRTTSTISLTVPLKTLKARPGQVLEMKKHFVVAASPVVVVAVDADSEGNNQNVALGWDFLEMTRNYRISR